jgi:hypothetical protein
MNFCREKRADKSALPAARALASVVLNTPLD